MVSQAQLRAQTKYDKSHTKAVYLKLNQSNDADILAKLEDVDNRQGYLKKLIRQDIRGDSLVLSLDAIRYFVRPVAKRNGIRTVYVFGSYARGEATAESDVDLMIEGGDIHTADRYFAIDRELKEALGKNVDLVMAEAAKTDHSRSGERFISHFERDKVLLYEA